MLEGENLDINTNLIQIQNNRPERQNNEIVINQLQEQQNNIVENVINVDRLKPSR